jgi:hypothetical protein
MVADLEDEVKAMDPDANEYSEEGATAMLKKLAAMKKKVKNQIDGGRKFVFFSLSHLSPSLSYFLSLSFLLSLSIYLTLSHSISLSLSVFLSLCSLLPLSTTRLPCTPPTHTHTHTPTGSTVGTDGGRKPLATTTISNQELKEAVNDAIRSRNDCRSKDERKKKGY